MYEFLVIYSDSNYEYIIASDIQKVLESVWDKQDKIVGISKCREVTQTKPRVLAKVTTDIEPALAQELGCRTTPAGTIDCMEGTSLTLFGMAVDGWRFDHWEKDGEPIAGNESVIVEIDDKPEQTFTAVFRFI